VSSSLRRGTLAATVLALSVATLSACGAGPDASTQQIRPDNAMIHKGDVKIQDVQVITTDRAGGQAAVTGRIFNNADRAEKLQSITLGGPNGTVTLHPAEGGSLNVPAHGWLTLGGKDHASAVIDDPAAADVKNGEAQKVVFHLSHTGAVSLRGLVVPVEHGLNRFGPSAAPTSASGAPEPTATPSESPTRTPGAGANTVTPTAHPSASIGTPES
jgi:hypothetical protein